LDTKIIDSGLEIISLPPNGKDKHFVSVVIPSYNHADYIIDALESVAKQTFQDFNVYIIDDASVDNSIEKIQSFINNNPEISISLFKHNNNLGGVQTLNQLISIASGEYIGLLNSDDVWLPNKLRLQVEYLLKNQDVGAVFTQADIVDDKFEPLSVTEYPFANVFMQKNRSSGEWLRRFFFEQNCLCHPSILIRKEIYKISGEYDARFRQLPDQHMWGRLLKVSKIHVIQKPLVLLRWHLSNTSTINKETTICNLNEVFSIYSEFFDSIPKETFIEGFKAYFINRKATKEIELECEKAFLYFKVSGSLKSIASHVGLQKLYKLLSIPDTKEVLETNYDFSYAEFIKLRSTIFFDESLIQYISTLGFTDGTTDIVKTKFYLKEMMKPILKKIPFIYKFTSAIWNRVGRGYK